MPGVAAGRRHSVGAFDVGRRRQCAAQPGGGIAEGDVAEADVAAHVRPASSATASGCVARSRRLQVEVLEDAVEERQRALHLDLHVEQLAEREEEARTGAW